MSADGRPDPARVVADADVLAADLLCGESAARETMDVVRSHSWMEVVASGPLLDDAEAVVAALTTADLAADWRAAAADLALLVDQPASDHPALASALRGNAAHVVTYDEALLGARTGVALKPRVETSVKRPDAFARLFDPASLYDVVAGGEYPGPDRDPRS